MWLSRNCRSGSRHSRTAPRTTPNAPNPALITVVARLPPVGRGLNPPDGANSSRPLGIDSRSKSQVPRGWPAELDEQSRRVPAPMRLDTAGPFHVRLPPTLTMKVQENKQSGPARLQSIAGRRPTLTAPRGNGGPPHVATKRKPGRHGTTFFADLIARNNRRALVTSDAHKASGRGNHGEPAGAGWQRCRTHYAANLMDVCPRACGRQ